MLLESKGRSTGSSWTSASCISSSDRQSYSSTSSISYDRLAWFKESFIWQKILQNQRLYYIANLLLNSCLLSCYTVMAFTPHQVCLTATGMNITEGFAFAFKLGFYVIGVDFFNAAFLEFYIR